MGRTGIIYCALNKRNNKAYIGQTIKALEKRITSHYFPSEFSVKSKFKNALKKYDRSDFEWSVLQEVDEVELNKLEILYIALFDTKTNGYNTTAGGDGFRGGKHTEASKELMRVKASRPRPYMRKSILMYDYITGKLIGEYDSAVTAANTLNVCRSGIHNNIKGISEIVKVDGIKVFFEYKK